MRELDNPILNYPEKEEYTLGFCADKLDELYKTRDALENADTAAPAELEFDPLNSTIHLAMEILDNNINYFEDLKEVLEFQQYRRLMLCR